MVIKKQWHLRYLPWRCWPLRFGQNTKASRTTNVKTFQWYSFVSTNQAISTVKYFRYWNQYTRWGVLLFYSGNYSWVSPSWRSQWSVLVCKCKWSVLMCKLGVRELQYKNYMQYKTVLRQLVCFTYLLAEVACVFLVVLCPTNHSVAFVSVTYFSKLFRFLFLIKFFMFCALFRPCILFTKPV